MASIDFKEIKQANGNDGKQDTFELFAQEFFCTLSFEIAESPGRGPDDGKDLVIIETRRGTFGEDKIRWLVSCKHYAHSGNAVGNNDEINISDRMEMHNCNGFISFYSTIPSSGLNRTIERLREKYEFQVYNNERIERELLNKATCKELVKRFFPKSYERLFSKLNKPANILLEYLPLACKECGKDLLLDEMKGLGIVGFVAKYDEEKESNKIIDVFWTCKGKCDNRYCAKVEELGYVTCFEEISTVTIPTYYVYWMLSIMRNLNENEDIYSQIAYENLRFFLISASQHVMRRQTSKEIEFLRLFGELPI